MNISDCLNSGQYQQVIPLLETHDNDVFLAAINWCYTHPDKYVPMGLKHAFQKYARYVLQNPRHAQVIHNIYSIIQPILRADFSPCSSHLSDPYYISIFDENEKKVIERVLEILPYDQKAASYNFINYCAVTKISGTAEVINVANGALTHFQQVLTTTNTKDNVFDLVEDITDMLSDDTSKMLASINRQRLNAVLPKITAEARMRTFIELCHLSSLRVTNLMRQSMPLAEIITKVGFMQQDIARLVFLSPAKDFARLRYTATIHQIENPHFLPPHLTAIPTEFSPSEDDRVGTVVQGNLKGRVIPIKALSYASDGVISFSPAPLRYVQEIMEYLGEILYRPEVDLLLKEFAWWFVAAMPYEKGVPLDVILYAIARFHGFKLTQKQDASKTAALSVDLETFQRLDLFSYESLPDRANQNAASASSSVRGASTH